VYVSLSQCVCVSLCMCMSLSVCVCVCVSHSLYVSQCVAFSVNVSMFTVYGNLNRICILLLCENCINLNCVELVHSAFQVLFFCLFIQLMFESLILKLQLRILIYPLKK